MKTQLLLTALLASSLTVAHAQDPKPLRAAQVPVRADAPLLFAPRGWKIEHRISGDLNRDKIPDTALVLVEDTPAKDKDGYATARQRALVVLVREGKGWHRVGFNGEILLGTRDGGAFYGVVETPVDVSIKRGVLAVTLETGSRDILNTVQRFRYDTRRKAFYLIGFDSIDHDRISIDVTAYSTNFLTGIKKTTTMSGKNDKTTVKTSRVSTKLRTLESIRTDDRSAE